MTAPRRKPARGGGPQPGRATAGGTGGAIRSPGARAQGSRSSDGQVRARSRRGPSPVAGDSRAGGDQVEGRQAVRELLRAGRRRVREVLVADGTDDGGPVSEIVELAEAAGVGIRRVPRARVEAAAVTDAPQGVVAFADPIPEATLDDVLGRTGDPFLVVLDGVTDPHNLGAVLRSALCAGATGVVVGRHRSARVTPVVTKAAAGAVEHLPVVVVAGIPAALVDLSRHGVWTVGLAADGDRELWSLDVATAPVALVLGAEGRGLSPLARRRCDVTARIPLAGPLTSLNVGAAAALACFEVARGRAGR